MEVLSAMATATSAGVTGPYPAPSSTAVTVRSGEPVRCTMIAGPRSHWPRHGLAFTWCPSARRSSIKATAPNRRQATSSHTCTVSAAAGGSWVNR